MFVEKNINIHFLHKTFDNEGYIGIITQIE